MKLVKKGAIVAGAVAGLFACAKSTAPAAAGATTGVMCAGVNECKGQGMCGAPGMENTCKGQNACKGKGVISTNTAEDCTGKGGTVVTPPAK